MFFSSCDYYIVEDYTDHIGVIDKSKALGDKDFKACFEEKIFPYYYGRSRAAFYAGKDSVRSYFEENFLYKGIGTESGYITFRFIINCKGEAGRYEIREVGMDFKDKKFHPELVDRLFERVKTLKQWNPVEFYGDRYDSFYHLTFKIVNGEIDEILP